MMEKNLYPEIPKEKFAFIHKDERIHDEKLQTKSISYLGDAWLRFRKNKSSVVAFCLIVFLLLFAIITPFISPYTVQFRDGYYKSVLPKNTLFENAGFWDGARKEKVSEIGYHYYNAIGQETGVPVVKKEYDHYTDSNGVTYYNLRVDSYALVGFAYVNLSETEYNNLMAYQNEKDIQVIYPLQKTHNSQYMMGNGGANFWYQLKDESVNTNGDPALDENGSLIPNYLTSDNPNKANYNSKRIAGDDGADGQWYTYAQKNQTGYRVRVHYLEYFRYVNGYEPTFIFGTNNYGQDIFTCLAVGARLSFLLSIVVASINFILGVLYGSIEGYYGGAVDMVMERISDVLNSVPFMVVATLFQLHLAEKVGVLPSLLFAFVLTGWVGTAARVRTQFYRFKGQEYVLAARTLGASDARLIFKHIFPNSLGTIVTGAVMTIPGVIFSESMLSYLHIINLETSSLTGWVGTAARVRTQFYRFKGQEYVLAARTLGASDARLIFKHIFPNSLGTIVTGAVMTIPGVIFSESMLSYLHIINLETSSLTSIGTLLSGGQAYLSTYPHIIMFPAIFIAILEIAFNLFGNGLRDALNPSLRGADD